MLGPLKVEVDHLVNASAMEHSQELAITSVAATAPTKGAPTALGHHVGRGTIANILREYGINPGPERGKRTPWSTFLKAHWECIAATDFFTVEVFTLRGLVTHYVLFFLDLAPAAQ